MYVLCSECARLISISPKAFGNSETLKERTWSLTLAKNTRLG